MRTLKIGLALGGGGPKGLAHIGVIKELEKNNIPIYCIAGTSIGALIGGFYAYSKDILSVESYILNQNWIQTLSYFADPSLKGGFVGGNKLEQFLEEYLKSATFEKIKIPFQATAVDIQSGKLQNIHEGELSRAIRASCAAPVLFKPVEINGHHFLDGGLLSSVPVQTVKAMGADIIIAVQLNKFYMPGKDSYSLSIPEVGELALNIIEGKIASEEVKHADCVISPAVEDINWDDLLKQDRKELGIRLGKEAAAKAIPSIGRLIKKNKIELTFARWIQAIKKWLR